MPGGLADGAADAGGGDAGGGGAARPGIRGGAAHGEGEDGGASAGGGAAAAVGTGATLDAAALEFRSPISSSHARFAASAFSAAA